MDCGVRDMPDYAYFPARIQTHFKNQGSHSSPLSPDTVSFAEPIPSPRRWSPTYQPRRRSRKIPSLSFVPSPVMPRIESHDFSATLPRRQTDRNPACMSPFRSVRRMKEPFQLMLPSSPASLDSIPPNFHEKPARSPRPPAGRSLRTWRSDQNLTCDIGGLGLLPSPPITESRPASIGPETSYFDTKSSDESEEDSSEESKDEREETESMNEAEQVEELEPNESVSEKDISPTATAIEIDENINYQAYHPPDWEGQPRTDVMNVHEAHSEFVRQCESVHEPDSPAQPSEKATPSVKSLKSVHSERNLLPGSSPRPQRPRTGTVSSEASWVPSNFSYCERWLQGVPVDKVNDEDKPAKEFNNRRKFQIVENDPPMPKLDIIPGAKALEEPVRFVVVPVQSRPKLVDIARQSSPSVPLPPPPSLLPQTVPTTPDQRQEEVSAFSPDTPLDMSDSGYGTRDSGYSFASYDDMKADDDDAYTDPGSLTSSDSVGSTVVCENTESAEGERETFPQLEIRSGSASPKASSPIPPTPHSPGRGSNKSDKEGEKPRLWHQDWNLDDHEWTLSELDHSVKDFPRNMLRLTSPVILFLRKSDEEPFIKPFRTIFPDVSENLLDCLCAALLARNYCLSLSSLHRNNPSKSSISVRNDVPTKAYSTLGIQIPSACPAKKKERALGSRSIDLRTHLERIVDNLLFAICGRSDPTLKAAVEVLAQVLETNA